MYLRERAARQRLITSRRPHMPATIETDKQSRNRVLALCKGIVEHNHAPTGFKNLSQQHEQLVRLGIVHVVQHGRNYGDIDRSEGARQLCSEKVGMEGSTVAMISRAFARRQRADSRSTPRPAGA
jgi:hypothetical protein